MGKDFHISDILSITGEKLVSTRHMDGVYDILNYMTGESLFTHQLPRAARVCRPALLKQHPQLAQCDESCVSDPDTAKLYVECQVRRFGEMLTVEPLAAGEYTAMDPVSVLLKIVNR